MQGPSSLSSPMPKRPPLRIPHVDVRELRETLGLSVPEFAYRFGLTTSSVRNWESGATEPYGVAKILLAIIARHPEWVDEALAPPAPDPLRNAKKPRR